MRCYCTFVTFLCLSSWLSVSGSELDFDRDIAPLLARRCLECHFGDEAKANLDLSTREAMLKGGENGAALTPHNSRDSLIWQRVLADEMPEEAPLAAAEKQRLRQWIEQGAPWGDAAIDPYSVSTDVRAGYDWWSLQQLQDVELPAVKNQDWVSNPIDVFVLARLESAGLSPSPAAMAEKLKRRLYYDLTGLPPSVRETEKGPSSAEQQYQRSVDRLLASPQYGQRWARHWLDVVRFGESHGFEYNQPRNDAWHYRNWVIDALNVDMPYDRFVRRQIAGDIEDPDSYDALAAVGFLVAGPHNTTKPSNDRMRMVMRHDELEDIVGTIGQTFLGLTVNCARCHDHKFDPITQREYYQLVATVVGIDHGQRDIPSPNTERAKLAQQERERLAEHVKTLQAEHRGLVEIVNKAVVCSSEANGPEKQAPSEEQFSQHLSAEDNARRKAIQEKITSHTERREELALVKADRIYAPISRTPPKVNRLSRGDVTAPAEPVRPAGIRAVNRDLADFELSEDATDAQRRLRLADWVSHSGNALFARVIVNRVWHYHFGQGLVRTPSDFGFNGDRPSHPQLLDFLANELIRKQWNLKPLHRMILTSSTYRQSSARRPDAERVDAENRLLWRMKPRRLSAEEIRDSILMVAGQLDDRLGGAGYRDMREYKYRGSHFYDPVEPDGPDSVRRTVYRFTPRGAKRTILDTFDCPDPSAKAPKRAETITPLQALSLMNHYSVIDMAQVCAVQLEGESSSSRARIARLYRKIYGRAAEDSELDRAEEFVNTNSLADLCRVLFNSNEFLYVR